MRIYISGKITGLSLEDAHKMFENAEKVLASIGHQPVNPMKIHDREKTWHEYMVDDIIALFNCLGIYMLTNWRESKGARIEHTIALETGLKLLYQ